MLAVAYRLPSHPRPQDVKIVTDVLPADFYPESSPTDRAFYAADAAVDKARGVKKALAQYNFKVKVCEDQDEQVRKIAQWLSDAKKEADRARADRDSFLQADGQRPSTSGTQRHFASSRSSSTSSQRLPPQQDRRDDTPTYRGGKGGRGKGKRN